MCLRFLFASSSFDMPTQKSTPRREASRKTHFIIVIHSPITCDIVLYSLVRNVRKYH